MQNYDAALKLLIRRAASRAIELLSGKKITKWLDVELPKTQNLRMDLLGEDEDGGLHQFELQSKNERGIDMRMAEYKLGAKRLTGKFPKQFVLYVGEAPMNIVFAGPAAGEAKTVDEMVATTERGVLVTRLWYIREVEPYEKMLTGMTRDGTFLIENGKLNAGLRNFRFNQSLIEMLLNVEAMSEPVRASGEESFDMVVPAMKVNDFNFTEVTKF